MGEIADALRKAGPLEPARTGQQSSRKLNRDLPPFKDLANAQSMHGSEAQEVDVEIASVKRPKCRLSATDQMEVWRPARICLDDPRGHTAQQFRRLAIRFRDLANSRNARSVVITSAESGDGKTTTACNLAIALAMTDHDSRVVLVDLDLHRASIASALGVQVDISVEAVLRGEHTLEEATIETDVDGLSLVIAESPAKAPEQLLASNTLAAMIDNLANRFDWVIIDTPPILATSDAQVILQHADGALLVARAAVSPVRTLQKALEHLPERKVIASFLNSSRSKSLQTGYYNNYYHRDSEAVDPEPTIQPEKVEELDVERL